MRAPGPRPRIGSRTRSPAAAMPPPITIRSGPRTTRTFASAMPEVAGDWSDGRDAALVARGRARDRRPRRVARPASRGEGLGLGQRLDAAAIAAAAQRAVGSSTIWWPISPALPFAPRWSRPSIITPPPMPVPSVTHTSVRAPRPAPDATLGQRERPRVVDERDRQAEAGRPGGRGAGSRATVPGGSGTARSTPVVARRTARARRRRSWRAARGAAIAAQTGLDHALRRRRPGPRSAWVGTVSLATSSVVGAVRSTLEDRHLMFVPPRSRPERRHRRHDTSAWSSRWSTASNS